MLTQRVDFVEDKSDDNIHTVTFVTYNRVLKGKQYQDKNQATESPCGNIKEYYRITSLKPFYTLLAFVLESNNKQRIGISHIRMLFATVLAPDI